MYLKEFLILRYFAQLQTEEHLQMASKLWKIPFRWEAIARNWTMRISEFRLVFLNILLKLTWQKLL